MDEIYTQLQDAGYALEDINTAPISVRHIQDIAKKIYLNFCDVKPNLRKFIAADKFAEFLLKEHLEQSPCCHCSGIL